MKQLSKGKQLFLYIAPFVPLVFFKIWACSAQSRAASSLLVVSLLLAYCLFVISLAAKWDKPTYFDWAVAGYFLFASSFFIALPDAAAQFFSRFAITGVYSVLMFTALVPLLVGKEPFTMHYARKYAPESVWRNPVFIEINRIMTWVWSGVFFICALLSVYPSFWTRAIFPLVLILGFGVPFNLRFPDRYLRKIGLPSLPEQRKMADREGEVRSSLQAGEESQESQQDLGQKASGLTQIRTGDANRDIVKTKGVMKILALNSSPRGDSQSKTELVLKHLVQGMREASADVTVVHLREKTVKNCMGCFVCWTKSPGRCVIKDDMTYELYPLWLESDLVVYASPLYHYGLNATMRAFIERTLPILEPYFVGNQGATAHPYRHPPRKTVVVSVAGFPEKSVFDQLSSWVNFLFGRNGSLVAEIYRPFAEGLTLPFTKVKVAEVFEALQQAGKDIVSRLVVSNETLAKIAQPLTDDDPDFIRTIGNIMWKSCIARGLTPKEFAARGGIPRPDSIDSFLKIMEFGFNYENAHMLAATVQFNFTGTETGSCYFAVEGGSIKTARGNRAKADLVIDAPFDLWMDILTKQADGQQMYIEQKYKAKGNIGVLMKMEQIFGAG